MIKTMINYPEVFERLAATASRLEKEAILTEFKDDKTFAKILKYAYDPFLMFGVKQVPQAATGWYSFQAIQTDLFVVLDQLATRQLTGQAALGVVAGIKDGVDRDGQILIDNIIRKDLRCGISEKTINKVFKKLIPSFELMLAEPLKDAKIKFPAGAEIKFDGLRCCALYDGKEVQFLSRGGKPFDTLDFLADDVIRFLGDKPGMLDGEVMGDDFNKTISGVKRKVENELTKQVKFVIFDHLTLEEFDSQKCTRTRVDRYNTLQDMLKPELDHIRLSEMTIVHNMDEAQVFYKKCLDNGHEGAMLKNLDQVYEFKRVKGIGKMKPSETADCEIIGFEEGTGQFANALGAFIVNFNGKACRVGTGLKAAQRIEFWEKRSELLGSLIEVKYMEITESVEDEGGKMRHPVFVKFRTMKGSKV